MTQVREATSAGGVVVRHGDRLEICLISPAGRQVWALPKGGVEPGETPQQAALREVGEETGMYGVVEDRLGAIDYWFSAEDRGERIHKTVHYFLVRATGGTTERHDGEVSEVRWVPVEDALRLMTYPNEREMVRRAVSVLGARRTGRGNGPKEAR